MPTRQLSHSVQMVGKWCMICTSAERPPPPKQMTNIQTAFTARVATLDSVTARSLYREMFNQPLASFEALDIVLNHLIDIDGNEATEAFIDTVD